MARITPSFSEWAQRELDELAAKLGLPAHLLEDPYAEASREPRPTGRRFVATWLGGAFSADQLRDVARIVGSVNDERFVFTLGADRRASFKPRTLQIVAFRNAVEEWSGKPIIECTLAELDGPSHTHTAIAFDLVFEGVVFDSLPEERSDV